MDLDRHQNGMSDPKMDRHQNDADQLHFVYLTSTKSNVNYDYRPDSI